MRISDCSSDVCSSDLLVALAQDGEPQGNPHPYETQRRQSRDDRDHIDAEPPGRAMSRQCHGLFRASEDRGQLFAEQHEDDTVERELDRSEEHPSALQSLMRISYAVFCLKTKINT